jgi:hypothetical protein
MKLKKKEFLALKQGEMSVIEYRDKFVELSHYAPEEVVDDVKKQELFLEGLAEPLRYQLISHTFPSFQMLIDKAIGLEYVRKELEDIKRKATTPEQFGSNTRPRFNPPQETPFQFGGPIEDFGQQQFQCPVQQTSRPSSLRSRQMAPVVTPMNTRNHRGTACLRCGKVGHYVNARPKRNAPNTPAQSQNNQQIRNESQISKGSKGKQNYARSRVNHVSAETAQENPRVVFGMCLVNSALASVLFDAGATHSFITSHCAAKLNIPMSTMPRPMLVSSARGDMKAIYRCNRVNLQILGKDFHADPIVLDSIGIDVVLGMGWLGKFKGEIRYAMKSVLLTSLDGEQIEFAAALPSVEGCSVNQTNGESLEDIKVVCDYPDVFPDELPGMPPDREVEFVIDLLPGTAPISKRPYKMSSDQ